MRTQRGRVTFLQSLFKGFPSSGKFSSMSGTGYGNTYNLRQNSKDRVSIHIMNTSMKTKFQWIIKQVILVCITYSNYLNGLTFKSMQSTVTGRQS